MCCDEETFSKLPCTARQAIREADTSKTNSPSDSINLNDSWVCESTTTLHFRTWPAHTALCLPSIMRHATAPELRQVSVARVQDQESSSRQFQAAANIDLQPLSREAAHRSGRQHSPAGSVLVPV